LPVDIHIAMDSLLTRVEESNPSCAAEIQTYYRLSTVWLDIMQQATVLLEEDKPDSAEKLVVRAQILERKSPYTWQLLATIASKRDQLDKALEYWQKTFEAAGSDTTLTEVRMQALYFMGEVNLGLARTKQGAEAVALNREAAKWFRQHLAEDSRNKDSPAARANLGTALMQAGDTAQLPTIYADLIANPTQYTAADHLQAGVSATVAGKTEDAVKLFQNALATSPFDRDALYNLCVSMFQSKMYQEMVGPARQLVEIDPNNPDNHELLVYAYAMIESTETDPVRKKGLADSLSKYNPEYERVKSSHKVTYSIFHRGDTLAVLTGSVQNLGTAERSFPLVFDFVDKDRNVIGQGEATVGPVKPNEAVAFEVSLARPGVMAFKARPIPPT
jgi:tetratricopeptide (TPR) repeat protein